MERLLLKFKENWKFRKDIAAFNKYLKAPQWIILSQLPETYKDLRDTEIGICIKKEVPLKIIVDSTKGYGVIIKDR